MAEAQPYTCETLEIASAALGLSRRITVCIPKPARQAARNPVLYLNDGQNLFDSARSYTGVTWRVAETASWLIERGVIPPIVIVGIDHGELRRGREYLPVEDERNPFAREPLAAEYAAFVTDELMPAIEREFPVGRGATYAAFGGSSVRRDCDALHGDVASGHVRQAAAREPVALCGAGRAPETGEESAALAATDLSWCRDGRDAAR